MSDPTCRDKECLSFIDNGDGTFSQQVTLASAGPGTGSDTPVLQCLQDDTGATFFVTYLIDPTTGLPSAAPIYMDVNGNPYTPTGTITKPKNPLDTEVKLFCDSGNGDAKFLKVIVFDEDGAITNINDVDLLGAAYTPVGPVEVCEAPEAPECELVDVWTCDFTNAVNGVEESEWTTSAIQLPENTEENVQIEGGFTAVNGCGQLTHSNPPDAVITKTNADTTNIGTQVPAASDQHELNFYAKLDVGAELFSRIAGASGGAIYAGTCAGKMQRVFKGFNAVSGVKTESIGFFPAGVYRFRIISHDPTQSGVTGLRWDPDADGTLNPIPAANLFLNAPVITRSKAWITKGTDGFTNLDGTPLVATATQEITCFDPCAGGQLIGTKDNPPQCQLQKIYVVDETGANGATEQYWEGANALDPGNTAIVTAFTEIDECGVLAHSNTPDSELVITSAGARSTDPTTGGLNHQNRVEGYIVVPAGGKDLQLTGGGLSSRAAYLAPCSEKLQPVADFVSSGSETIGFYNPGVYHFVMFNHDDGTNGNTRLRWKNTTATTYVDIPLESIYVEPPRITNHNVWITKGEYIALDVNGNEYNLRDLNVFECDPCDNRIPQVSPIAGIAQVGDEKAVSTIVGTERLQIANGGTASETLTVPAAANGAILQVQITDKVADGSNCARYFMDGRTATAARGYLAGHKEFIYLGCAASNEATVADAISELADFNIHFGELTDGAEVEVTYYAF